MKFPTSSILGSGKGGQHCGKNHHLAPTKRLSPLQGARSMYTKRCIDSIINRIRLHQTKLNAGLFKINVHQNGLCDTCSVPENFLHFISKCTKTVNLRQKLQLSLNESGELNLVKLLNDSNQMKEIACYCREFNISI